MIPRNLCIIIIHNICDTVIRYRKRYKRDVVVVYDTIFTQSSEICNFIECDILYKKICTCLKKIQSILPVYIIKCTHDIDTNYFNTGEGVELSCLLTSTIENSYNTKRFNKINDFTVKYELTFLNETYFNKLTTKYLLI